MRRFWAVLSVVLAAVSSFMTNVIAAKFAPWFDQQSLLLSIGVFLAILILCSFVAFKHESSDRPRVSRKKLRERVHARLRGLRHRLGMTIVGGVVERHPPPQIVGREDEQRLFVQLLHRACKRQNEVWALCMYGFGGIGKSTLIERYASIVSSDPDCYLVPRRGTVVTDSEGTALETLPTFLMRVAAVQISAASSEAGLVREIARRIEHSVILIDNCPSGDSRFNDDLKTLIETLAERHARVLIVTASRILPALPATLPIATIEIKGLNRDEVRDLISRYASERLRDDVVRDIETFCEVTKGNPWIIKAILGSPDDAWKNIRRGVALHEEVGDVGYLLTEIWRSVKEPDLRKAIETLCVVGRFSKEWPESIAASLVQDWPDIHVQLRRRAFVERYSSGLCRLHDLLSDYVYGQLKDRKGVHLEVANEYRSAMTTAGENSLLALNHYIEADNLDGIESVYRGAFEYVRDRVAAADLLRLIAQLEPYSRGAEIQPFVTKEMAYLLLRQGKIAEALDCYEKARQLSKLLKDANSPTRLELDGEILWGMADCQRMLGHFGTAMALFLKARNSFEDAGSWQTRKYVHSMVEIGHGHYLKGEPRKSMELYKMAEQICERNDFKEELAFVWYRMSKSLRLQGLYKEAADLSNRTIEVFGNLDMAVEKAKALWNLGTAQRMQGVYVDAEKTIRLAQDLFRMGGHRDEVFTMHDLAEIARARGHYDEALRLYEFSLSKIEEIGDENRVAHSRLGILETNRLKCGTRASCESYREISAIYRRIRSKWGLVNCVIAEALCDFGNKPPDARVFRRLRSARRIAERENMQEELRLIDSIMANPGEQDLHPLNFT